MRPELVDAIFAGDGNYLDATVGGGGHLLELLRRIESGNVVGLDLDEQALQRVAEILSSKYELTEKTENSWHFQNPNIKVTLVNENFARVSQVLEFLGVTKLSGVIADLGFASDELDAIPGLSYSQSEALLDMRFRSASTNVKAADILQVYDVAQLQKLLETYADLRTGVAKAIANQIVSVRSQSPLLKVADLNRLLEQVTHLPMSGAGGRSIYSRVYQALRMVVNDEVDALQSLLREGFKSLDSGGKLGILTFHSGEEKTVTAYFDKWEKQNLASRISFDQAGHSQDYLRPEASELRDNLAARSAKLFAIQKL